MIRIVRVVPIVLVMSAVFVAVIVLSKVAATAGLISDDAVTLWASAITAGDGEMPIGRIVAAYPTIPFLATALLEFVTPPGAPTPVLLTAGILALLAGVWLSADCRGDGGASSRLASGSAARGDCRSRRYDPRGLPVSAGCRAL